jgi:NAD(P)-dependent dehydrogenase (short-subunit alcohol dehydrogenase family)
LHGAKVYVGARSESRAKQAISDILSENSSIPKELLEWLPLDLSSLPDVIKAANMLSTTEKRLDVLSKVVPISHFWQCANIPMIVNNAGIASDEYLTTKEGFEQSLGVK